jgi:hypothetical protein
MQAIRWSDKNFHLVYERSIGGGQGSESGCEDVVELAIALQKHVTVHWKACARIR